MSGTILVADDSQAVRDILQMSLETLGYKVLVAEDGERAMESIVGGNPDLIIADVMMPKVNGFQICRRVKSNPTTRRTPVILLTARSGQEDVFWGKDCGADEYITKPFRTQDLEQTIARLLRRQTQPVPVGVDGPDAGVDRSAGAGQIVVLRWEPRAMDVFHKKYGEMKFSEALDRLKSEAERFLRERRQPGPVAVHVPDGLSAVLRGSSQEALGVGRALAERLSQVAVSLYDQTDRVQGHIRYRDPRSGRDERLPLLSFSAAVERDVRV